MDNEKSLQIIDQMAKNEILVSVLYKIYAEKFPEQKEFWSNISNDETVHAQWLNAYIGDVVKNKIYINKDRFSLGPAVDFSNFIQKHIDEAKNATIDLIKALAISYDLENSMLEHRYFEIYESDSVELKHVFENLRLATSKHAKSVRDMLDQITQKNNPSL